MEIKGNMKKVEPRKPVVSLGGVRGDLSRILEPIKQNLEILTGRRAGVKELKGLPQATPRKQIISKINELVARLNGSGTVTPEQAQPGDKTDGEYAPLDHTHVKADITDFPNLAMVAYSGSYEDLHDTPTIPVVPTNVSAFVNDAGYITSGSLTGYLPLAGGTMDADTCISLGGTNINGHPFLQWSNNNYQLVDLGYADNYGARLELVGLMHNLDQNLAGGFVLRTDNGTMSKELVGGPDGTLTWDGHSVCLNPHTHAYLSLLGGTMSNGAIIYWGGNSSLRVSGDTTKGMYVGCGTAGTGAGAELALYNQAVGAAGKEGNFELTASTVESSQSGGTVVASVLKGTPDGALTWGGTSISLDGHTHSYNDLTGKPSLAFLPLAGGEMEGNIVITPYYDATLTDGGQVTLITKGKNAKGTAPSATEWHTYAMAVDRTGSTDNAAKYGQIETAVKSTGEVETYIAAFKPISGNTTSHKILVGSDASGNAYTSAPTPPAGDNSTQIATTAWVTTKTGGYLPLSGGEITGNVNYKYGITKWTTTPSSTQYQGPVRIFDGDGTRGFALEVAHYNNAKTLCKLQIDKGAFGGGSGVDMIAIGYDRTAGAVYTIAPTPPAGDNSTQIATTAWVTTKAGNYLPLAGGVMTGAISRNGVLAQATSGGNSLSLVCGDNNFDGASLQMFGRSHSSYAGRFYLRASNKSSSSSTGNSYDLVGYPDGNLNWTGSAIKVNGTVVSLDGHTHSYLPLSGGTMSGAITRSGNLVVNSADNSWVRMNGGTSDANGAFVLLYGKSHSSGAGQFQIRANDGTTNNTLVGYADGQLTWGGSSHALAVGLGDHTFSNVGAWGYITSSSTSLVFYFPIIVVGSSVSISTLTASVRVGTGGYTSPGGATAESLIPSGVTKAVVIASNMMRVTLTKSAGWGATNNTTVCLQISSFKFTVS